ncbi:SPOSA6832_00467 [Sporobolomyces salmonicolor]|uniref:SPOSA6832_00467-mRNA-1:cds n=1 Tax=Sporidiobolus salmonicolor TaxID=5005 RepID=A0A0D6EG89_SPOSA|nr:SPOSA6832_00467 [Sporobolomyces salmonicolor]
MSTDEFIVIVADREGRVFDEADDPHSHAAAENSVPLIEIVDSFEVFHTGQGAQGLLARPSKQQLETVFETTNEDAIVEIVLSKGRLESSDGPLKLGNKNDQRAGTNQISAGGKAGQHGGR